MKALSVHGGGDESDRISDNDGGCALVVVVWVDAMDNKAVLVGLEVVMVDSVSQSGRTDDGRGDFSRDDGLRQIGDCLLNRDPLISSLEFSV